MKIRAHIEPLTSFNAISLTDIIFLLLIFFLLSSSFVLQPGLKVQLPVTSSNDISSEKSIVVSISPDGTVYLNDEIIGIPELGDRLKQKITELDKPILVLRADKAVTVESLVEIMDIAKTAGGDRLVIATAPKKQGK